MFCFLIIKGTIMGRGSLEIIRFEPSMCRQVAELDLIQLEDGVQKKSERYRHLLFETYPVKHSTIGLVGVINSQIVAAQLFMHWPLKKGSVSYKVFQSGNSLVHPNFRGQGIFQKMLSEGSAIGHKIKADFFIGFPVQMSYGAFIKDGWVDVGNLRWWTKVLRPIKLARQKWSDKSYKTDNILESPFLKNNLNKYSDIFSSRLTMRNKKEFIDWRYSQNIIGNYHWYEYVQNNISVAFLYKLTMEHGYSEILVGETYVSECNTNIFTKALKKFCDEIKKKSYIQAISFALLSPSVSTIYSLIRNRFVPHKKTAPLLSKTISSEFPTNKYKWDISLGCIDTWG
jgi:hypothetical protein